MPDRIAYIDQTPVVAIDPDGIYFIIASGERKWRMRTSRGLWRRFLENEIRNLNDFEMAERMDKGRIVPFKKGGGEH